MFLILGPPLQRNRLQANQWWVWGTNSSEQHQHRPVQAILALACPWPALIRKLVQSKQILTTSFIDEPGVQSQRTLRNDWHMLENKISLKQAQSASWGPEVWFSHRWEEARRGDLIQENNLISQALPTCFTNYLCSWGAHKVLQVSPLM